MTRSKGHSWASDEEFVRAADEVLRHIEVEHNLAVVVNISTSVRRTVLSVRIVCHYRDDPRKEWVVAAVQGDFPNVRAGTLASYLFALSTSLDHTLDAQDRAK